MSAATSHDRTEVAFIGGHGRSGSTLLSRLLEGLDGVCSVGEMRNLWDNGILKDYDCACGEPFSQCDFWTKVGIEAFGGWDEGTARRALALRRRVDRLRSVPRLLRVSGVSGVSGVRGATSDFGRAADEYAGLLACVYAAAAAVSGSRVVVDSSKLPSAGYLMSRSAALDPRVVHLVRDSRGVAYSWTKVVRRGDAGRTMARSAPARTAIRWGAFNTLTALLARRGLPTTTVRYEDLIAAPAAVLGELADFLDVPLASDSLDFVRGETVDLPVDHSVWGNPVRSASGPQRLRVDEAWRTALPARHRRVVTLLSLPGLVRYRYLSARPAPEPAIAVPRA